MNRYSQNTLINGGTGLSTSKLIPIVRRLREAGQIKYRQRILKDGERLEHVAAQELGSSQLWWVLAAMSDIGWPMQLPPGTVINIPTSLGALSQLLG